MERLKVEDFGFVESGLSRPECILCTATAGMFVSHDPVGVLHIAPDGSRRLYGRHDGAPSAQFTPNGIALMRDGRLMIANSGLEGGVWQVDRRGDCRPFLMEVEGRHLYPANFVLADEKDRLWICVSTRQVPRAKAYRRDIADGYIVLWDGRKARIVAEGLGYTNECRLTADGAHLYVNETFGRRISRFSVSADGSLGNRETFAELGVGDYPDGGTLDALGGFWVTSVVSNRIYRFDRDGHAQLMFEDVDDAYMAMAEAAYRKDGLTVEILYADAGETLNHIASIAFGGPDMRTAYLGTLKMNRFPTFRSPVRGLQPAHWNWKF
ncbi:MAG: SMP-30/gluconolactonase/LRE family protein [Rhizobiaceae bacterium]|nr:SMP-30/gluconolactonase/LRE family protein [Rhizobiaceae bacterium]